MKKNENIEFADRFKPAGGPVKYAPGDPWMNYKEPFEDVYAKNSTRDTEPEVVVLTPEPSFVKHPTDSNDLEGLDRINRDNVIANANRRDRLAAAALRRGGPTDY